MAILVTGGAGYIGSVMVEQLVGAGRSVVVLDNLSRGHRGALDESVPFYEGRIGDRELVERVCREHSVEACIHFAALAYVGESVTEPKLYFENNSAQGLGLLEGLLAAGVRRFVFSSGATARRGEHHEPETHLIPNVLAAAAGRLPFVSVFGGDYPTPDGTCVRDYIHVTDLCSAHTLALEYLGRGGASDFINLGNGFGYSVMEVIEAARRVTGREIEVRVEPARAGDPARLVADATKAREVLGWRTRHPELEEIVRTAWEWHQREHEGYGAGSGASAG
jgi:UDP-glucose 4-epimerase